MFKLRAALGAAVIPLLLAGTVFSAMPDHGAAAKPKKADVIVESITVGPPEAGSTHRDIIVVVRNKGTKAVGPFDLVMAARRDGFERPPAVLADVSLNKNQSKVLVFPDLGCKWTNPVNDAEITVSTDPAPVPGETGRKANNKRTIAPNINWSAYPECL